MQCCGRKSPRLAPGERAIVIGNTKCEKCDKVLFVAAITNKDFPGRDLLKTVVFSGDDLFNKETQLKEGDMVVRANDGKILKVYYR